MQPLIAVLSSHRCLHVLFSAIIRSQLLLLTDTQILTAAFKSGAGGRSSGGRSGSLPLAGTWDTAMSRQKSGPSVGPGPAPAPAPAAAAAAAPATAAPTAVATAAPQAAEPKGPLPKVQATPWTSTCGNERAYTLERIEGATRGHPSPAARDALVQGGTA